MKTDRSGHPTTPGMIPIALCMLAVAVLPAPVVAQSLLDDCTGMTDKGERIKCKTDKVHGQLAVLVDDLTDPSLDFLTPNQQEQLRRARDRAEQERSRTGTDDFKRLTKRRDARCFVTEYDDPLGMDPDDDGNNDGICDKNELCLEDDTDQLGDNDSKCERIKTGPGKPTWEACVEICDPQAIAADEDNFDDEAATEIELELDDTAAVLEEAAGMVDALRLSRAQSTPAGTTGSTDATGPCSDVLVNSRQFDFATMEGLLAGSNAAKLGADTCRAGCGQEAFGWNCRAACLAFGLAENVLKAISDAAELQDDAVTAERLDAATECIEDLDAQVKQTAAKLTDLQQQLDAFVRLVEQRLDEATTLLNTPLGRRPQFPVK